jgi:hypothetical protein
MAGKNLGFPSSMHGKDTSLQGTMSSQPYVPYLGVQAQVLVLPALRLPSALSLVQLWSLVAQGTDEGQSQDVCTSRLVGSDRSCQGWGTQLGHEMQLGDLRRDGRLR